MTAYDPIPEVARLGYTEREAAFLYLVGRVSGYFLGRQYSAFLNRKPGALVYQLIEKGRAWQHLDMSDYGQHRYVYHLKSKRIYQLLECPDSQNRRAKGDDEIKNRLMVLDYVLEHLEEPLLALAAEKIGYLKEQEGIELSDLSPAVYFAERFPVFVLKGDAKSRLRFTYFDNGTITLKAFSRYLTHVAPLFGKLDRFELAYIALSARNFASAQAAFDKAFPEIKLPKTHLLLPFGVDHLVNYFLAQRLWDENSPRFKQEHLAILREGERVYCRPEHDRFRVACLQGPEQLKREVREVCGIRQMSGTFTTTVLRNTFPMFRCRIRGKPVPIAVLDAAV